MVKTNPQANLETSITRHVFIYLSATFAALLLVAAGLAWWAHVFIGDMVTKELSAQKIYFPEAGSVALDADTYPGLQQYGGQMVDTPEKAKAYANEYIAVHLDKTAGGMTYSEVSAAARQDPSNETLQEQRQTLFMGEMIRGTLLTSGYGFGTIGQLAGIAAFLALGLAGALAVIAFILRAMG